MRLLDLYCGAGGASVGYHRAGFDVVGVDREPHPDYPYEIIVADALDVASDARFIDGFDVVAASPPCQRWVKMSKRHGPDNTHPDLITPTRALLQACGARYIIENVETAPLTGAVLMCGSAFNLAVRRHRHFESSVRVQGTMCAHHRQHQVIGVYGKHAEITWNGTRPLNAKTSPGSTRGIRARSIGMAGHALGIDWMTQWTDLTEAIPPAYTAYLGRQIARRLQEQP